MSIFVYDVVNDEWILDWIRIYVYLRVTFTSIGLNWDGLY